MLNLSQNVVNADGSTTIYDEAGTALKTLEPDGTSLIFAKSSGIGQATPLWFSPNASSTLLSSIINGGGAFQTTMNGVTVFKMYEAMLTLPDATLKPFFSYLSAHHIALAIEGLGLVAGSGQPGYGTEGFAASSGDLSMLLTKLKADGGNLSYIAWDQPYTAGVLQTGLSLSTVASEVASAASQAKAVFPNAKIGDIEPVGSSSSQTAQLQSWFNAYASGSQFDFFQEDISGWYFGWQNTVASVTAMARANSMSVSDIVEGNGVAATNLAWSTQAASMAQQIMSDPRLRPDLLVVQSWQTNPSPTMDPTQAGTLASVAQDVETGLSSASAVPAVARYDASGLLKTVTWSGGWTATVNGTNVVFSSPTGAVVSSIPWSAVRAFAFDPTTGGVTETVASTAATTTQPEKDTTNTVNVVRGQFVFASVVSSGAGTLTMALASTSDTGFSGSGVTNQTKPTLTGSAPAGATVQLQVDGAAAGSVVATAAGAWTFTINSALSAGAHLIDATSATPGGATQEREYVVSANLNQRLAPTLALAQGYDTGYAGDNITDVTKPVLAGATDPQVQLTVSIDGKQVGLTTSDASGNWQYSTLAALALGDHTVSVHAAGPPGTFPTATSMQLTMDTAAQEAAMTSTDPLFDPEWYIKQHPDAGSTAAAAYQSYMTTGWKKGYDPSPFFSTDYYLSHYADVVTSGMNPLQHFEQYGWREGRNPSGSFDTIAYYNAHPNLATSGIDPVVAYINSTTVTS
jgi:hypothetical protein